MTRHVGGALSDQYSGADKTCPFCSRRTPKREEEVALQQKSWEEEVCSHSKVEGTDIVKFRCDANGSGHALSPLTFFRVGS